jgi:ADP-heptose:LPS heptosyltransferase
LKEKPIAIVRPGALGDILCILSLHREIRETYGEFDFYCHDSSFDVLQGFAEQNELCDGFHRCQERPEDAHRRVFEVIGYPIHLGYPKNPMRLHLKEYISNELQLKKQTINQPTINKSIQLPSVSPYGVVPLVLPEPPKEVRGHKFITIQNKTGWSRYKELYSEQWETIINFLHRNTSYKIVQVGGPDDPPLKGIFQRLNGRNFTTNTAAIAHARMHVGVDSVFNHLTGSFSWSGKVTPAVIFFGSTSPVGSGYAHNLNVSVDLPCQPCYRENPETSRMSGGPCPYDHLCIKSLTAEEICEKIDFKLNNI